MKLHSVLISIFFLVLLLVVSLLLLSSCTSFLLKDPPIPINKYGEYPFRIVFEHKGETHTIEDVLICEYDGIAYNEGWGKYVKWRYRLMNDTAEFYMGSRVAVGGHWDKSHYASIVLLKDVTMKGSLWTPEGYVDSYQEGILCCDVGYPDYYLSYGAEAGEYRPGTIFHTVTYIRPKEEALWDQLEFRLIEATFAPPTP